MKHLFLHEGGHGHEGCCGAHTHGEGSCHSHGEAKEISPEQTPVLLTYMLDHNRSHADELHGIVHALEKQGKADAAKVLAESVELFNACNSKLAEALDMVKGE